MFKPRWLHKGKEQSKIVYNQMEYDNLWSDGWRGSPADVNDDLTDLEEIEEQFKEKVEPRRRGRPRVIR